MSASLPFAEAARQSLGDRLYRYLLGAPADAAGEDDDRNARDLSQWRLVPRVLAGQSATDIGADLAGRRFAAPIGIGAFAGDRLFHPEGLKPLARVARALNLPMIVSEETVTPLAEITVLHDACWLQLRAAGPLERIRGLVDRAAGAGVQGMVFTVLAPTHPAPGLQPGGFSVGDELVRRGWTSIGSDRPGIAALPSFPAWGPAEMGEVIAHCRARGLPALLKGILHPDDAVLGRDLGAAGLVASNIGLRQSARWVGAPQQVPDLAAATDLPVILDGGVRSGTDAVVARCLGARLSLIVRPVVTALAGGGEAGVSAYLSGIIDQIRAMTHWLGAGDLDGLGPQHLASRRDVP